MLRLSALGLTRPSSTSRRQMCSLISMLLRNSRSTMRTSPATASGRAILRILSRATVSLPSTSALTFRARATVSSLTSRRSPGSAAVSVVGLAPPGAAAVAGFVVPGLMPFFAAVLAAAFLAAALTLPRRPPSPASAGSPGGMMSACSRKRLKAASISSKMPLDWRSKVGVRGPSGKKASLASASVLACWRAARRVSQTLAASAMICTLAAAGLARRGVNSSSTLRSRASASLYFWRMMSRTSMIWPRAMLARWPLADQCLMKRSTPA